MIAADPSRYSGKGDYDMLAELGHPIACNGCESCEGGPCAHNEPKRRSRLRRRLRKALSEINWITRYDPDTGDAHYPASEAPPERSFVISVFEPSELFC